MLVWAFSVLAASAQESVLSVAAITYKISQYNTNVHLSQNNPQAKHWRHDAVLDTAKPIFLATPLDTPLEQYSLADKQLYADFNSLRSQTGSRYMSIGMCKHAMQEQHIAMQPVI